MKGKHLMISQTPTNRHNYLVKQKSLLTITDAIYRN